MMKHENAIAEENAPFEKQRRSISWITVAFRR